jgi:predicted dehydrogenase
VTLRIGILGTARIAIPALIEAALPVPEVTVSGVAARDLARASGYAAKHGIPQAYGSYDEMLADPEIDAVYNPLPNSLHAPWTLKAIAAGKHVLCEKPFASNAAEAADVAVAADESGLVVMEAMHYRYHPLITRLSEEAAAIGPVRRIQCWTSFTISDPADIRYDYRLGGGALMDGGCYALDCIRLLAGGEPVVEAAIADTVLPRPTSPDRPPRLPRPTSPDRPPGLPRPTSPDRPPGPPDVDVAMAARLSLPGGGTAWFDSAFTRDGEFRADLHVIGENGQLWLGNFIRAHEGRLFVTKDGSPPTEIPSGGDTSYTWQLRAFAAAITTGAPIPTTPQNAVATMHLIDNCYRAAALPPRGAT